MEGPSLVILKEELEEFNRKKIISASGNSKLDFKRFQNKILQNIQSRGKHLILSFNNFSIRIHFLMFGSYRINERKPDREPRLSLKFTKGEINFYSCSIKVLDDLPENIYDWRTDVLSEEWNESYVYKLLSKHKNEQVCDVLMNQEIFGGVGNIIKNEVLFNLKLHPETKLNALKPKQVKLLITETRHYCEKFYSWKKAYQLKKQWKVFRKRKCKECGVPVEIRKTGKLQRISYICNNRQRNLS